MTERYMHLTHASAEGAIRLLDPPSASAHLSNMVATGKRRARKVLI